MRKGILAMEELNEPEVIDDATLTGDAPDAEAMTDVVAAHDEVIGAMDDIDAGVATGDAIEEVRANVATAAETEGGLSEPEARALDVAVEHMLVSIGMPRSRAKVFPAMEGFREKTDRLHNTKVALESFSEKLALLWKRVMASLTAAWELVVAFVKSLVTATGRMQRRAEGIKKAAAAKKDGKAVEIKVKGSYAKLVDGGKIATNLAAKIGELGTHHEINLDFGKMATDMNRVVVSMVDAIGKPDAQALVSAGLAELEKTCQIMVEQGATSDTVDLPLGDSKLIITTKFDDTSASMTAELKAGEVKLGEKVEGLSPADAIKVADAVIKDLAKFAKYEKESGAIAATMKGLSAKMGGAMAKIRPGKDEDQAALNKATRQTAQAVQVTKTAVGRISTLLRGYNTQTLSAALDYAGASVAAIGKTEAAKAPAAAAAAA